MLGMVGGGSPAPGGGLLGGNGKAPAAGRSPGKGSRGNSLASRLPPRLDPRLDPRLRGVQLQQGLLGGNGLAYPGVDGARLGIGGLRPGLDGDGGLGPVDGLGALEGGGAGGRRHAHSSVDSTLSALNGGVIGSGDIAQLVDMGLSGADLEETLANSFTGFDGGRFDEIVVQVCDSNFTDASYLLTGVGRDRGRQEFAGQGSICDEATLREALGGMGEAGDEGRRKSKRAKRRGAT